MSANLPARMSQRQAVELGDDLRDAVDHLIGKYAARGFDRETVKRELEHGLRLLAAQYAPQVTP